MPKQEIETGRVGGDEYTVGQRVCVVGRGTAAILHLHGRVEKFTRTLMVVSTSGAMGGTRRYRLNSDGGGSDLEIGHGSGYGGTYVAPRCQRPKGRD